MSTAPAAKIVASAPDPHLGYRSYTLGSFRFTRDEYFARIEWPTGMHMIEIDRFLRAIVRDIGWRFFYGWIFFDDVFGTLNHYGTVEVFAGSYNPSYKKAKMSLTETFPTDEVRAVFQEIAKDWISEGYDPLSAPSETGSPLGAKGKPGTAALERGFAPAKRMLGLKDDVSPRSDAAGQPVNRAFKDLKMDQPVVKAEAGFEGQIHAINVFDHVARSDVTWNPSVTSVTKNSIFCMTSEEHMLPVIHGNDRNEWFIQLTDEIHWQIYDKESGLPRGRAVMRAGDVCAMPADIRHQGYAPKRAMLLVAENGSPELPELYATGKLPPYPVDF
jgi:hypothetical protein